MFLGRIQESPSGYDLRTFECHRSPHQLKTAVKLGDPMQSKRQWVGSKANWLHQRKVASALATPFTGPAPVSDQMK
jgi:hypothetical protein